MPLYAKDVRNCNLSEVTLSPVLGAQPGQEHIRLVFCLWFAIRATDISDTNVDSVVEFPKM